MAPFREHRTHTRLQCRVPLELKSTAQKKKRAYEATIYNVSQDGVYIETSRELEPGEQVHLHLEQLVPRVLECGHLSDSTGVIRWSRPTEIGRHRMYRAGIRLFLPRIGENAVEGHPGVLYYCDMCGITVSLWDVRRQKGPVWLCSHCERHLERYQETVCRVMTRYLIGNAL